jgi:ankyrin repeat protein
MMTKLVMEMLERNAASEAPVDLINYHYYEDGESWKGATPLHIAAGDKGDIWQLVEFLIDSGADINAVDGENVPVMQKAIHSENFHVMTVLLAAGVDMSQASGGSYKGHTMSTIAESLYNKEDSAEFLKTGLLADWYTRHVGGAKMAVLQPKVDALLAAGVFPGAVVAGLT